MKRIASILTLAVSLGVCCQSLYGWNNQHWLGNGERVVAWEGAGQADYLRLGVLKEGVYRLSAGDIAAAFGMATNAVLSRLAADEFALTCGTNSVAWTTDGTDLFFYGEAVDQLYAPESVYFLRAAPGLRMAATTAPPDTGSGTNAWFMQRGAHRSLFLDVRAYFDRRSSNASIMTEPVFGMSLGDGHCNRTACEFNAPLPGLAAAAATNLNLAVHAISYGDYAKTPDTHTLEVFVGGISCGSYVWSGEQRVTAAFQAELATASSDTAVVRVANATVSQHFLLLDVAIEYPRSYTVGGDGALLCTGGDAGNISVGGSGSGAVMLWDITDPFGAVELDVSVDLTESGWTLLFGCGAATNRYAVFETERCFEPSVAGFSDIDWNAPGAIPALVIVTPPRRWVDGFEAALAPLVQLRRAQGLGVRVVDAEDIYNAFSHGLVHPQAFRDLCAAGISGEGKLRYLLFAGYASTDYKLEVFYPDTVFKNGKKGFPALFPLLQVYQREYVNNAHHQLLLPNDMMLGDADNSGVPDVAVGRFLATDAAELAGMVAKTVAHDRKHPWNRAVLVADWNGPPSAYYNFSGAVQSFRNDLAGAGWNTDYYYCESDGGYTLVWKNSYYETGVWYDLHDGRDFFYYLGHSSDTVMGYGSSTGKYILKEKRDRPADYGIVEESDWRYAPFAMAMGCRMGRYTSLDLVNLRPCIMEAAAKHPNSAFCGSVSSAGYISYGDAKALTELFLDEITLYGARRIGDAWIAALDQFGATGLAGVQHTVFLGDPSMPLYKPVYPTILKLK